MANYSIFVIFLGAFVAFCQGKCPSNWDSPRKDIVCYYSGKQSASNLDACLCTHLVYNNIGINQDKSVVLQKDVLSDFGTFRDQNPSLKVIASIGGESLDAETFSSLITEKESLENFTSSINSLYSEGIIHGIEIDWEWPVKVGGKKDRIKLIRYARQIKIAVGEEVTTRKPRQRDVRSAEDENTTIDSLEERSQPDDEVEEATTLSSPSSPNNSLPESESTTKKSDPKGESDFILEPETSSRTPSPSPLPSPPPPTSTTTIHSRINSRTRQTTLPTHSRHRGFSSESRLAKPRTRESFKINPHKARQPVIPSLADDEELDLIDLENDDLTLEWNKKTEGFTLFLRLPSTPEYLVQGYDFALLNKFVDYYTLSTNNLPGFQNVTFHHSRLMGVSDVENADSLLDVITSLGADERKLILTATSFGNKFSLLDVERTLPGAATTGKIETITYQQVCQTLKHGNWTVERDEDLTAPYGFNNEMWMAFDDAMSLRIKTKYALLRNLGGVALDAIEADDIDNICGHGEQSLLKTIRKTLTQLERKTRQLIVHSLEEDLIASPQTLSPVIASGINVSPFRIVRIVDREGQITGIRQNSETTLECTRQGYYRNPEDCSLFYRCVKFNQYEDDYTIFEYGCPAGLVFDERWEVCVWPSQAAPCDGSSEIRPVPRNPYICNAEGYFVDPENCRWFFACFDHKGDGTFTHYEFRCPFGLGFDEANLICNWPWLVPGCGGTPGASSAERTGKLLRPDLNRGINRHPERQEKAFNRGNGGQRPALNVNGIPPLGSNNGPDPFLNSFKSQNPARQSTLSARPATPVFDLTTTGFATTGSPFPSGATFGDIVADGCDNCESQGIRINGHGSLASSGIEVVRTGGFPSTTPIADDGSYLYPVPENPLVLPSRKPDIEISNPGEVGLLPEAPVSIAPILSTTPGYDYPIPSNPLQYPDRGEERPIPSTTLRPATTPSPVVFSTTVPTVFSTSRAPVVSTTYAPVAPVVSTTYAPVAPVSESGYVYPVPENPLEYPDYIDESAASGQPIYQSSTPGTFFVPEQPAFISTPRTPAPTFPAPTAAPFIPSTARPPIISTTYQDDEGGYAYPIPANPLVLPERQPRPQYTDVEPADFNPPPLEFGGFKPPFVAEPEQTRTYQQPSHISDVHPKEIEFGFQPVDAPAQRPRQPFAVSDFDDDLEGNAAFVPAFTTPRTPTNFAIQGQREVASVIPSGFTSATLSNGPNSVDNRQPLGSRIPGNAPSRPTNTFFNNGNSPAGQGNDLGSGIKFGAGSNSNRFGGAIGNPQPAGGRDPNGVFGSASGNFNGAIRKPENNGPKFGAIGNGGFNGGINGGSGRPTGSQGLTPQRGSGFGGNNENGGLNGPSGGRLNGGSGNKGFDGPGGNGGFNGQPGIGGFNEPAGNGGFNRPNGNGGFNGPTGNGGFNRPTGNGAGNGQSGNGGFNRPAGNSGFNRPNGNGGFNGPAGNGGFNGPAGNGGFNGPAGNGGFNGPAGNGGFDGPAGNGGGNGPVGNGGFNGPAGNGGGNGPAGNGGAGGQAGRGGREFSQFKGTVPPQPSPNSFTAVTRPVHKQPAVISKFKGTDWNKFGPGGFRAFNDTIGPEVCERPGLFRHPTDCDKFYECFYDKWIDKFTVHVFPCPIVLGYDTGITACNWPFEGPHCEQNV